MTRILSCKAGYMPSLHRAQAFHAAGWTREAVLNVPNALSMGRLISGPIVAYLILEGHWAAAMGTLTVAGAGAASCALTGSGWQWTCVS